MTKPLFQFGEFQFDIPNGVPQTLDRTADYRWEEQGRLLREPAWQFIGPGSQTITLDGVMLPQFSGRAQSMDTLRSIAEAGEPQMFTNGLGKVFGRWAIKRLREGQSVYVEGGGARRIDFTVELVKYGEDEPGLAASPLSIGASVPFPPGVADTIGSFTADGSAFQAVSWAQNPQFSAAVGQAQSAGFNLGQLASMASAATRAAGIVGQVQQGQYVQAALSAFGLAGFNPSQSSGWAEAGINATNLAQSFAQGNGPTGMALAMEALAGVGQPVLSQIAGSSNQLSAINTTLQSAATLGTMFSVDPKITNALRPLIALTQT